ncbi:MAG TPA: polyribonucleotide nucleotidyltransferase, partial [Anaerolineae bacterium]|nr:polyribonucleotide nucleotidyltransferase [Anaerolineae bacterium]
MKENHAFTTTVGGETITFESGKLAGLAGGAVSVRQGEAMILATATMARTPREGIDFFPLSVDYEERLYAGGRIPGSFFRREGRPSEAAILVGRLTDRPLRPLFPKDMRNDVQVIITSLSSDGVRPLDILAINGASAALMISDVPFGGPVGAVRVGYIGGEFVINPTYAQMEQSDLDLRIAGTADAILMVECGANELSEELMVQALLKGHAAIQPIIALQNEMRAKIGKPKDESYPRFGLAVDVMTRVTEKINSRIRDILINMYDKDARNEALDELEEELVTEFAEYFEAKHVKQAFHDRLKTEVRDRILNDGIRPDGRSQTHIRPLSAEVDLLPRTHGSGLFTRGETQVLSIATLGTTRNAQELDGLAPQSEKRYLHHYNFPPFSTGEARPLRGQSRREIGHGALAERALMPVLPPLPDFPYTIRVVSEVLSSNGSTSMASVCGSTLALMDAGVPIRAAVAGIAMGLISDGARYTILTDIQGMEDHLGDMDFKVAGTAKGITALQMDIKISGLTAHILQEALEQARAARMEILGVLTSAIAEPRPDLKPHTPRITTLKINPEKIGAVIGPGGKVVRSIQDETGVTIDIQEDGTIYIAATDSASAEAARARIEGLTESPELGRIYTGKVVRTTDFGAFVEIMPGIDGMVHISQLADFRAPTVDAVVKVGDEVMVMVTDIDPAGKIRLSRRAVLEGMSVEQARNSDQRRAGGGGSRGGAGGSRGPRRE